MTDIIASPAVKEAVKVVMEQQERLGDEAAAEARESQPIRTSVLRAAQLAAEAEDHARGRQHVKGKLTARERLDLLLDTGSFEEIGRFRGGDINGGRAGSAVITGFGEVFGRKVAVYAQDFSVKGGTLGVAEGRKICHLMDKALDLKVPIIALIDSGGARIQEGVAALTEYGRLLDQKSALLRERYDNPSLLQVLPEYDLRMAQTGALVISYRARYVKALAQEAARYHREFSGDSETLELTYRTVSTVTDPFAPPETLCAQLQEHQRSHARAELESAQCLSGPHKDDFEAVINGLPVAQFASQGQTRTAVISLKLAERALLRQGTGETPVLLLDDVLSELDAGRQDFVLNQLREGQVFITCCETDRLTSLGQVLSIRSGTIGGAQ